MPLNHNINEQNINDAGNSTKQDVYDLAIIGAGPAGLTAALYGARYMLNVIIISKDIGGNAALSHRLENFPSYKAISGTELTQKIYDHVMSYNNVKFVFDVVETITKHDNLFVINNKYKAKKVIIAIGTKHRKLGLENEDKFIGKGISYCATCDASFFKDKVVGVVGGSDSAVTSAILLTEYAKKVYVIYRRKPLRAEPIWIKRLEDIKNKKGNVEIIYNTIITKLNGKDKLESVTIKNLINDQISELRLDGLFIEIGSVPDTEFVNELGIMRNENGYIIVDKNQETNIKGIFAAGDVTNNVLKQVITSCAEGAIAAYSAFKSLKRGS